MIAKVSNSLGGEEIERGYIDNISDDWLHGVGIMFIVGRLWFGLFPLPVTVAFPGLVKDVRDPRT